MVAAVFPAAGQGSRMKVGCNKVFLELMGMPVLVRTLLRFSSVKEIEELIVIVASGEEAAVERALRLVPGLTPWQVVTGSTERQYSIENGLKAVSPDADIILIHDAARPLVTEQTIEDVIRTARIQGAAIAAVPEKNTIKVVDDEGHVKETPERRILWEVQTPQGFRREILLPAYERAREEGFLGTDDASLVERTGASVAVVRSTYANIKVTTPEDLVLAEALLRQEAGGAKGLVKGAAKRALEHLGKHFKNGRRV